jgi:hypothetical protein
MRELGQIGEGCRSQLDQMLPLQVAAGPFARHGGDALGAMLRQDGAVAGLEFPLMVAWNRPAMIRTRFR